MTGTSSTQLRPATREDVEYALAHALRFDGKKAFKFSHEAMAKITAAHLAEFLSNSLFVVMKAPPVQSGPSTHGSLGVEKRPTD